MNSFQYCRRQATSPPHCRHYALASSVAYASYTYHSRDNGALLAQKDIIHCTCTEQGHRYEETAILRVNNISKPYTVVVKKYACRKVRKTFKDV